MTFTGMDKAVIFVSAMFSIVELWFLVEIIMGAEHAPRAFGIVVLLFADACIITSYLRHRHEYR